MYRRAIGLVVVLGLFGAACGHANGSSTSTSTTATTTTPASATAAPNASVYASGGSFTVGVVTLHLPDSHAVEVWYPANGAVTAGSETYDVRAFLPGAVAGRLPATVHIYVATDATRNVEVGASGERFPLVIFSHGFGGTRDQSTFLTTRLASWGMIVAAPEDPSLDLTHALAPAAAVGTGGLRDVLATIDLLRHENARAGGPFQGRVDLAKIATVGLDAGGRAAMLAAADPRVDAVVSLASDDRGTPAGRETLAVPVPGKPTLFVSGSADRVVVPAGSTAAFRAAPAPSYEWVIDGAGHNAFADQCVVASQQGGLIALARRMGIGGAFSPTLRTDLTDGCKAPDLPVLETWPVIDQVVTAFLRHAVGPDPAAIGVGPPGTRTIDGVTVQVAAHLG